ncbi:MAG: F-box protein [Rhabdochlamydiaceae bacterium]|jgi:hypothetical protein
MALIGQSSPFPDDITRQIFAYLETKDLGIAQSVCKNWNGLAADDGFWKALFQRAYKEEVPEGKLGKDLLRSIKIIKGEKELQKVVSSFMCQFKWDKKRRFECVFRDEHIPPLVIEQGFGPFRGTEEGLKGAVDEKKCYEFIGDIASLGPVALVDHIRHMGNLPWPQGPPILEWVTSAVKVCVSSDSCFFEVTIEGVDIQSGDTLGFFSDINEWKEPFTFICVPGNEGDPMWAGRIPYSNFKFVKIGADGHVTWENIRANRSWDPRFSGLPYSWELYLQVFPIEFSS